MKEDYYKILDISKSASAAEIKKAYRKMAVKYHPDKNPGDKQAEEKFKLAAEAYDILSDQNKKEKYDRFGHAAFEGGHGAGGFGGSMNMEDIFSQFGDIFGGHFGGFGGGSQRGASYVKGSDLRIRVKLTLKEIAEGVEKKVKIRRKVQAKGVSYKSCSVCGGTGQVTKVVNSILGRMQTSTTCSTCHGVGQSIDKRPPKSDSDGMVIRQEMVSVNIPKGVSQGMQLKVGRKGNEAPGKNFISGDLLVLIEEVSDENLKREGSNIHYDLYINFSEAVLGTTKEINTVTGKVKIKIDSGTQSGKILRLKGKGLPSVEHYGNGDFLIHVNVWTPQELTKEQKKFFQSMKDDGNFVPNPQKSDKSFFEKVKDMFS